MKHSIVRKTSIVSLGLAALSTSALAAEETRGSVSTTTAPTVSGASGLSDRTFNFRINPIGLAGGAGGADLDLGVADWLTVGPSFSRYTAKIELGSAKTELNALGLGLRSNLYLSGQRYSDGWVVGPYAKILPTTVSQTLGAGSGEAKADFTGLAAGALMSYQWVWKSGFNVNAGAGIAYYSLASDVDLTAPDGSKSKTETPSFKGVLPNVELTVGYVF